VGGQVISFDALVASNSRMLILGCSRHTIGPPNFLLKTKGGPIASNSPGKGFLHINVTCHRGR